MPQPSLTPENLPGQDNWHIAQQILVKEIRLIK